MAMPNGGLIKLMEELGELTQAAAKRLAVSGEAYYDGTILDQRMEDEIGDVTAIIQYVTENLGLSDHDIQARVTSKYQLYRKWEKEG